MSGAFDKKGYLVKNCSVPGCVNYACISENANMRRLKAGDWWCTAHFKERQLKREKEERGEIAAARSENKKTQMAQPQAPKQGRLL
tara:strand:+ start:1917 stop:2174 length:258 start_codon:yes stop_codon:yes gene_type:complete